ncbi:GNAT family N-acetyltransferase [Halarcobacter ebronensis]|uniref:GNAT family N-acetyltransferase n=1 Tax=Halarcobacter ebronensis TaxID=1462615 RepID=A0A4Q1AR65_9BACT|nr:GNAT family N-acetyltransferase [Halarcobacter ebronensis]QKF82353.1 acetyltransferase (GNAT family) [Halarcobacter ebronensis]RXK07619.1 GNAT family N-acetyltransferase [Halarcobacter ebronensis]
MSIYKATIDDAKLISSIISKANKDIANKFSLDINNCPKHPSFYTTQWVLSDMQRQEEYFLYKKDKEVVACVAFENPREEVGYLNRLSVIPSYRHKGIGEELVKYIFEYAKSKNIKRLSIGIIAEHQVLKQWYIKLGFKESNKKSFPHLPFEVLYMNIYF